MRAVGSCAWWYTVSYATLSHRAAMRENIDFHWETGDLGGGPKITFIGNVWSEFAHCTDTDASLAEALSRPHVATMGLRSRASKLGVTSKLISSIAICAKSGNEILYESDSKLLSRPNRT